jgi:hypothetical protein
VQHRRVAEHVGIRYERHAPERPQNEEPLDIVDAVYP